MFYRELHLLINSVGLVALRAKMSHCRTDILRLFGFCFFVLGRRLQE